MHRKHKTFAPEQAAHAPDVTVNDGRTLWRYEPAANRAWSTDTTPRPRITDASESSAFPEYGAASLGDFLAQVQRREAPSIIGEEQMAGRDAYIVALGIPVTMSNSAPEINGPMDIWIDKETFFILKTVTRSQESDKVVSSMEVSAIRYNPSLDDALFTFTPPIGVTVSDQRASPVP
ncbi:MAG: hypothetical protein MI924_15525 [Chloroflexales bacterium]|nr:hypothetical protein [Chloroflexales bacterium]